MGQRQSRAVLILVLGIVSLALGCTCLTGIPAWIMGKNELQAIDQGEVPAQDRTMAQIGMILGIIGTILGVVQIVMAVLYFGAIMAFMGFGASQGGRF